MKSSSSGEQQGSNLGGKMPEMTLLLVSLIEISYRSLKRYQNGEDCGGSSLSSALRRSLWSLSVSGKCSFPSTRVILMQTLTKEALTL